MQIQNQTQHAINLIIHIAYPLIAVGRICAYLAYSAENIFKKHSGYICNHTHVDYGCIIASI